MALTEEEKRERKNERQREYAKRTNHASSRAYQKRTGYAAQAKYQKDKAKVFTLKYSYNTDEKLIDYLDNVNNRNDYIRRLVYADMAEIKRDHRTRVIPLFQNRFAAGPGEPDFGLGLGEYEIPENQRGDFAIRVSGDSMEPWLPDGSIQIGVRETPRDGDIAALMVDGEFFVKQVVLDYVGNLHMFSLNRARKDLDRTIWASGENRVQCFGTILTRERHMLPLD